MLPPEIPTWQIYAGDDARLRLEFFDAANAPINLAAVTTWKAAAQGVCSSAAPVSLTVDTTNAATGVIEVVLPAHLSRLPDRSRWDLQGVEGGLTKTFARGLITVEPDVTR